MARSRSSSGRGRARSGGGPTLIEALTYRLCDHTTADDATRYRSAEELAAVEDVSAATAIEAIDAERQGSPQLQEGSSRGLSPLGAVRGQMVQTGPYCRQVTEPPE